MGQKRSYKTYTKEFKEEAVALVHILAIVNRVIVKSGV